MLNAHLLKNWPLDDVRHTYTDRDTLLYALAIGYGSDPLDLRELPFVHEKELVAAPTLSAVLAHPGPWVTDPRTGVDWLKLVHGEQKVVFHRPLPATGTVIGRSKVTRVTDKGVGKGAIYVQERTLIDAATGELLATLEQVNFARGDGGYSANGGEDGKQVSDDPPEAPHPLPARSVDRFHTTRSPANQALLYRLCGDRHPIHSDPAVARKVGFDRPILHGLATYAMAGRAVLSTYCEHDPTRLRSLRARFSAPFYPGEALRTELWKDGKTVSFRCSSVERGVVVLSNGCAELSN